MGKPSSYNGSHGARRLAWGNGHPSASVRSECGVTKELVLVPKLGKGIYDIDGVDIVGASSSQIVDDGEASIAAQQQERKNQSLATSTAKVFASGIANQKLEEEAEHDELEELRERTGSEAEGSEADSGSAAEDWSAFTPASHSFTPLEQWVTLGTRTRGAT